MTRPYWTRLQRGPQPQASRPALPRRARAAELNIDLSTIKGTGKGGVITKGDIEAASKADVDAYEDSIAPVPGTMGLLQTDQVETGPDYGAIGGLEETDRLAQLQSIIDEANRGGAGGNMIRKLSEFQKSQPPASPAPPAMDMSRLDADKFPGPDGAGFTPTPPAMDMSLLGVGDSGAGAARVSAPWDRLSESSLPPNSNPVLALGSLDARDFPAPAGAGFDGFPESAVDTRRMSDPRHKIDLSQLTNDAGGAIGDYGPSPFTPSGGMPGEYGPSPITLDGGMPGEYGPSPLFGGGGQSAGSPGGAGQPPRDVYEDMGRFGSSGSPPADNSEKFLQSRGLSGLASGAAKGAWEFAKAHPFLTGVGVLGGGSLAMANLGGGGGTAPTPEEMEELARRRDEARAAAMQGYQQ